MSSLVRFNHCQTGQQESKLNSEACNNTVEFNAPPTHFPLPALSVFLDDNCHQPRPAGPDIFIEDLLPRRTKLFLLKSLDIGMVRYCASVTTEEC
mmetsp:Transcript_128/g.220  ORF Transcript_128/g.220 Transcript_128/m.220 type:complete len:95 (-) Transcript_128:124-408(-)